MILARIAFISVLTLWAAPAFAKAACYAPKQIYAEQLLRLHSKLMVITVTCHQASTGQELTPAYTSFTRKNIGALRDAEQTMIAYYKANERGNPVARLDRLRTKLGNEYGQRVAKQSAAGFCAMYRDDVLRLAAATADELDMQVRSMEEAERPYGKPCAKVW